MNSVVTENVVGTKHNKARWEAVLLCYCKLIPLPRCQQRELRTKVTKVHDTFIVRTVVGKKAHLAQVMSNSQKIKAVAFELYLANTSEKILFYRRILKFHRNLLEGFGATLKTLLGLAMTMEI